MHLVFGEIFIDIIEMFKFHYKELLYPIYWKELSCTNYYPGLLSWAIYSE